MPGLIPPADAHEWAEKLARGDGQGMVPLAAAEALYAEGYTRVPPKPTRHMPSYVMVRLKTDVQAELKAAAHE